MKEYPSKHKQIVKELMDGKFIIVPNPLFNTIQENEAAYIDFFKKSFGYQLNLEIDFVYLSSDEVNEKRTRDFTLFLAVLSRELDYTENNFKDKINTGYFDIEETKELLQKSSKWEILEKTSVADFDKFVKTWSGKNVLEKDGGRFRFTKAVKLFFRFAMDIYEEKLKERDLEAVETGSNNVDE